MSNKNNQSQDQGISISAENFDILSKIENAKSIDRNFIKQIFPNATSREFQLFLNETNLTDNIEARELLLLFGNAPAKKEHLPTKNLTKNDIVRKISADVGISFQEAQIALSTFTNAVAQTLKKGNKLTMVGFGTFSVSKRAARNGRNPQTGAVTKIKAKKVAKFKAGKELSKKIS